MIVVHSNDEGHAAHLQIQGTVTHPLNEEDPITNALGDDAYAQQVLLNMASAESIDSSGVGWLMLCQKRFEDAGGRLVMHSQSPTVANTLRILSLNEVLNIAANKAEALRMLECAGT